MDVRSQILEEATHLFAACGYEGTSLQAIAEKVGIRKASLLYHFPSKSELHTKVLDSLLSRWNEILPRLLRAAAGEDRFDAVLDETIEFFVEDPDRARLLLREILDNPQTMNTRLREHVQPWMSFIGDSIRKGQSRGDLRAEVDPEAYVLQVIHLILGSVATTNPLGVLLDGTGAKTAPPNSQRLIHELKRVARSSLFAGETLIPRSVQ